MNQPMKRRLRRRPRATLACAAALLSLASLDAAAQQGPEHPLRGPYLVAAVGRSDYDHDCFFFGYCQSGQATARKLGFGYRFGVAAIEAWGFDFGSANLNGNDLLTPSSVRMRAVGVGAAWTARFGDVFELIWRVGGAEVRHQGAGAPSADSLQPYAGLAAGLRIADAAEIEIGADFLRGRDGDGLYTHADALSLGLRVRF